MLSHQTDFEGWREAARAAIMAGIEPGAMLWSVRGAAEADLFLNDGREGASVAPIIQPAFSVSRAFVDLAKAIMIHKDPARFALLYRLLWRLRQTPGLLGDAADADVHAAEAMRKSIHRDIHKMHAFVRFKEIVAPDGAAAFIAWFEPEHYILEAAAPFFTRRFTGMRWSILTPYNSAFWDMAALRFGPGADKSQVPSEDKLEEYWLTYYASIFNPARLKLDAMQKEMPKKYWKNLPEAQLIESLTKTAGQTMEAMITAGPTAPSKRAGVRMIDEATSAPAPVSLRTLAEVRAAAAACQRCGLYRAATQTVFGEGPETADIMFVGEQPGDKEDLAGRPFAGPAGALFDKALVEAGVQRSRVYVTNAVKHFKYEPRGKFRLHKKPATAEIEACRWWLDLERHFLKPKLIVALGASAAQGLLGRVVRVHAERGRPLPAANGPPVFLTVHPSYLLRLPDEASKILEYRRFVDDLAAAARLAA